MAALVSVEEYIARFVEGNEKPRCEYLDGELIPKALPSKPHSQVQANIIYAIRKHWRHQFNPLPELSTRLRETQFYIPDIAVEDETKPITGRYPGPNDPVFLCVEVLSPPDRIGKLIAKCEEYHRWGVPYCWIIDPERRRACLKIASRASQPNSFRPGRLSCRSRKFLKAYKSALVSRTNIRSQNRTPRYFLNRLTA